MSAAVVVLACVCTILNNFPVNVTCIFIFYSEYEARLPARSCMSCNYILFESYLILREATGFIRTIMYQSQWRCPCVYRARVYHMPGYGVLLNLCAEDSNARDISLIFGV